MLDIMGKAALHNISLVKKRLEGSSQPEKRYSLIFGGLWLQLESEFLSGSLLGGGELLE